MKTNKNHYLSQEGYALMGAAFEVYNENGYGMGEEIYQESLEVELALRKIPFCSKDELQVYYKGHLLKKTYIPDLTVYGEIIVELKALKAILPEHEAQLINYMRISKKAVGYLINFGTADDLEWKRIILSEYIPDKGNR
ncbi:MAG: GxxExxY protein [Verrucomicrobia bacterium]|nr:GxxExxY protein [Verrucomicrobiota bacterium]MCH8517611.1 GxxExxY protein [Cyclobacteriaceae bacterium]